MIVPQLFARPLATHNSLAYRLSVAAVITAVSRELVPSVFGFRSIDRLFLLVARQQYLGDLIGEPFRAEFVQVFGMELGVKPQTWVFA